MNKTKSVAPLVLGIIGGILGILEGSCLALCGAAVEELGGGATWTIAGWCALLGAIVGLVGGCCAKSQKWGSLVELVGGIVVAVALFLYGINLMVIASAALLIIGGAVGMAKKAE